jgi:RNA polymerase sigma-70 factor (ECF subfamily)
MAGQAHEDRYPSEPASALEMMMDRYGTTVLRTAYFYLGDRYLAEDASQEAFLRAYRNWPHFRGKSRVRTWLTRIVINVCRDKMRLKRTSAEEPTDPGELCGAPRINVEEEALARLDRAVVLQQVLKLPAHYHEVLYLYYYLELSTKEIAEATDLPEGTVRARLHRARQLLGEQLREEGQP